MDTHDCLERYAPDAPLTEEEVAFLGELAEVEEWNKAFEGAGVSVRESQDQRYLAVEGDPEQIAALVETVTEAAEQAGETQGTDARVVEIGAWSLSLRLQLAIKVATETIELASILSWLGVALQQDGRYDDATGLLERACEIYERLLGPEHPHTLTSLNNLAALYHDQGRLEEAEPLYRRALAIREKALGPEHPDTLQTLSNLAALYQDQGRLEEAEPLYRRALAIREKALDPEHPDVATNLHNLAELYYNQDRLEEAEPLYRRALAIREKALHLPPPQLGTSR